MVAWYDPATDTSYRLILYRLLASQVSDFDAGPENRPAAENLARIASDFLPVRVNAK